MQYEYCMRIRGLRLNETSNISEIKNQKLSEDRNNNNNNNNIKFTVATAESQLRAKFLC